MEIDSWKTVNEVGIGREEALGSQPLLEVQTNFDAREKAIEIQKVSVERVKDSPWRSQLEGVLNGIIKPIIEPPHDLVT